MTTIPTPEELRKQIANAKDAALEPLRKTALQIIVQFQTHIEKLLANPSQFTSHDLFSVEMPGNVYGKEDFFFSFLRSQLPAGYRVEKGHDGGGMYSTVVIRWDEQKTTRRSLPEDPTPGRAARHTW